MSETAGALTKALAAFQAEMPTVAKSKTADTGSYTYTYAGLAEMSAAGMPLLSAHGLAFSCCPRRTESGHYELAGYLMHESGQQIEGALPLTGGNAQALGSSISYMRRYLFGCMTGLITDDDDDGALASAAPARKRAAKKTASAPPPPEDPWQNPPPRGSPLLDTRSNLAIAMYAAIGKAGIPEEERIEQVGLIIGRQIESTKQMTEDEARKVLDHLKAQGAPA
jgi:hypothetical protein